jgi:hypothetical protein
MVKEASPMLKLGKKYFSLALTLLLGLVLQGVFICADQKQTPNRAAVTFCKAYYGLDPATLASTLCQTLQEKDFVESYMEKTARSASQRGYQTAYLRSSLFHIETEVLNSTDKTATVRLTAKKRKSINPVYEYVGKLFFLLDTSEVEETLQLVKENDQWKVCSTPLLS